FGAGDPRVDPAHRADAVYAGEVAFRAARGLKPHAGWKRALASAASVSDEFSTHRMVGEYALKAYVG
ncbi:MAG: hypothetical protein RL354_935, partial [Planctomycetota bacterium]